MVNKTYQQEIIRMIILMKFIMSKDRQKLSDATWFQSEYVEVKTAYLVKYGTEEEKSLIEVDATSGEFIEKTTSAATALIDALNTKNFLP